VHIGRRIWFHWAVVACLVLGLAAAAMLLPRWGARSAKTTIIVDTAGRKIPGLFAGMPSDPRYDLALIALSPQRNFQKPHKGLMNWLLERVDTIVYAQSPSGPDPCNVVNCGICTNNYYESAGTGNCAPCTAIGTGFNKVAWRPDRADPNQGYMGSCSSSCECTAADGSTYYDGNTCSSDLCTNPLRCANDDKCPTGYWCLNGTCSGACCVNNYCHGSGTACTDSSGAPGFCDEGCCVAALRCTGCQTYDPSQRLCVDNDYACGNGTEEDCLVCNNGICP